jgi:type IV pilus assembly protein PilC
MPLFGDLMLKSIIARATRIFSLLSKSGVPLLQVLEIVSKTSGNRVVAKVFLEAQRNVNVGETLSKPLMTSKVFPPMVTQMIFSGEKAGALEEMMDKIADFYEEEVDRSVEALQEGLKPIMTFVLGGIILSVIMPLYLPIFKLSEAVGGGGGEESGGGGGE